MSMRRIEPRKARLADIPGWLCAGAATFRRQPAVSLAYGAVFAVAGAVILALLVSFGLSPLTLAFSGGFLLIGPIFLCGFLEVARLDAELRKAHPGDCLRAFRRAPPGLWALSIVCGLLFVIWITDAATLYSLYFDPGTRFALPEFLNALESVHNQAIQTNAHAR